MRKFSLFFGFFYSLGKLTQHSGWGDLHTKHTQTPIGDFISHFKMISWLETSPKSPRNWHFYFLFELKWFYGHLISALLSEFSRSRKLTFNLGLYVSLLVCCCYCISLFWNVKLFFDHHTQSIAPCGQLSMKRDVIETR
jgi:hypothetical protein